MVRNNLLLVPPDSCPSHTQNTPTPSTAPKPSHSCSNTDIQSLIETSSKPGGVTLKGQFVLKKTAPGLGLGKLCVSKMQCWGASLAVQWLGLGSLTAEGAGSIPGRGTKIPQATWSGQKKQHKNKMQCWDKHRMVSPTPKGETEKERKQQVPSKPQTWPDKFARIFKAQE